MGLTEAAGAQGWELVAVAFPVDAEETGEGLPLTRLFGAPGPQTNLRSYATLYLKRAAGWPQARPTGPSA